MLSLHSSRLFIISFCVLIFGITISCFGSPVQLDPVTSDLPPTISEDPTQIITNELAKLDSIIAATEKSLENQKLLRDRIQEYKKIQRLFLEHKEDREISYRMVKAAHRVLEIIKQNHLTHAFDPEFLSELALFSKIATKRGIPKP